MSNLPILEKTKTISRFTLSPLSNATECHKVFEQSYREKGKPFVQNVYKRTAALL